MNLNPTDVADISLTSVERQGNVLIVQMELTMTDGSTVAGKTTMPDDAMEWRSAEYGIPPEDTDTLLNMVLWEPFLGEPDRPDLSLHDAADIDEARTYHLSRIDLAMRRATRGRPAGVDPVRERIKDLSVFDPEAIDLKQKMVARARTQREEDKKMALRALVDPALAEQTSRVAMLRGLLTDRTTGKGVKNGN